MKSPMTFTLTFDDGFKVHYDIVAPLLEQHGWRGVFDVPTAFMYRNRPQLTAEQLFDFRLPDDNDRFMNWDDVRDLVRRGHEVYPHTLNHSDLLVLEESNDIDEVKRQVVGAKNQFVEQLGFSPKFFCSPHNSSSPLIARICREAGMALFDCHRPNYWQKAPGKVQQPIEDFLIAQYKYGHPHYDIMIHGIEEKSGGWCPFPDKAVFANFLDKIADVEECGYIKVVPFCRTYRSIGIMYDVLRFKDRAWSKLRREFFQRILYMG